MEWEVQEGPDLLVAEMLELDIVKVELVYKVLNFVSNPLIEIIPICHRLTIIKGADINVPIVF